MAFSSNSGSSQGSSSGFSSGSSQSGPVLNPGAGGYYSQLLNLNQQNYRSTLDSYGGGQRLAQGTLPGIYSGYGQIQQGVMNTLGLGGGGWGVATPAAQAIQRTFEQTQGQNQQSAISSGLSNTSVLSGMQNQSALEAAQAYGGLGAQLAQTAAGYQSQFGLAGLGARMQGLGMQTGLAGELGRTLGGYQFRNDFGNLYGQNSMSQNASQNSARNSGFNSGSSYSPSGGGGSGGGGGSDMGLSGVPNYYNGGPQLLQGYGSNYYGTGGGYGGYTPGSTVNVGSQYGLNAAGGIDIAGIDPVNLGAGEQY